MLTSYGAGNGLFLFVVVGYKAGRLSALFMLGM